jgi:hypothetical protein
MDLSTHWYIQLKDQSRNRRADATESLAYRTKAILEIIYIISRHFVILWTRAALVAHRSYGPLQSVNPYVSNLSRLFASSSFPVLLDVEGPLELQMGVVVIVDELGDGLVVATAEHAGGSGFWLD